MNGGGHTGDITGADGGCQGRGQGSITGDGAFTLLAVQQLAKAKAEFAQGQETQHQRQDDASGANQAKHPGPPDDVRDRRDHSGKRLCVIRHVLFPP